MRAPGLTGQLTARGGERPSAERGLAIDVLGVRLAGSACAGDHPARRWTGGTSGGIGRPSVVYLRRSSSALISASQVSHRLYLTTSAQAIAMLHGSLEGVGDVITSEACQSKADITVITETQLFF